MRCTLKTYAAGRPSPAARRLRFYILSKGLNAGRPSRTPHANSFEATAATAQDAQTLFWVVYALWKSGASAKLLVGSVIPFIRIYDYRKLLAEALRHADLEKAEATAEGLQAAEKGIQHAHRQIKLFEQYKAALAKALLNRSE